MVTSFFELRDKSRSTECQPTIGEYTDGDDPDCAFCVVKEPGDRSAFDLAWPIGKIALKPALGMLVPGYLLAITQEHVTSFAQLSPDDLTMIDDSLAKFEEAADPVIKDSYFRFEHGSDNVNECGVGAGACIDHAHQHVVPGGSAAERMLEELDWEEISTLASLSDYRGKPYMYMCYRGQHYAKSEPKLTSTGNGQPERRLPSQWGRQIIATTYDVPIYDWALRRDATNLAITMMMHNLLPPGQLTLDIPQDRLDYNGAAYDGLLTMLTVLDRETASDSDEMEKIWKAWRER